MAPASLRVLKRHVFLKEVLLWSQDGPNLRSGVFA